MQNVNHCHSPCMGAPQNAVYDKLQQSSNIQLAAVSSERRADITIMTDEEDRVTLSLDSHIQAVAFTYENQSRTESSYRETQGEMLGFEADRRMELSVQGDLNDQERKEIKQVLKSIFKMVKDFLAGKFSPGADQAQNFEDLETISSVKAEFEAKETAAYVAQSAAREVTQAQAPESEASPSVAIPQVSSPLKPEPKPEPVEAPAAAVAEQMAEAVKDSGVDPAKIKKPVDDMFGRLMRRFLKEGPFHFRQMRRLSSIMQEFSEKMNKLTDPDKSQASGIEPVIDEGLEQVAPMEAFTFKKSSVQTQVSIFEQSFSFNFEYSAARPDNAGKEEVSVQA